MHFQQKSIGPGGQCGSREGWNQIASARRMRRIGQHRKMRKLPGQRDRADVERVACLCAGAFDAAFAQDYIRVPAR